MLDSKGCQLEVVTSSLAPADLAAYCLDLAWRTAANEDFKACNLANYVQDVSAQARQSHRLTPCRWVNCMKFFTF